MYSYRNKMGVKSSDTGVLFPGLVKGATGKEHIEVQSQYLKVVDGGSEYRQLRES